MIENLKMTALVAGSRSRSTQLFSFRELGFILPAARKYGFLYKPDRSQTIVVPFTARWALPKPALTSAGRADILSIDAARIHTMPENMEGGTLSQKQTVAKDLCSCANIWKDKSIVSLDGCCLAYKLSWKVVLVNLEAGARKTIQAPELQGDLDWANPKTPTMQLKNYNNRRNTTW